MFTLYKIYFGDEVAYLGRTRQPINARLRGHFFKKKFHKCIDIYKVTKIECAETKTCADMYLYEIFYINKLHPKLNRDDVAPDELTIELPELEFFEHECKLMDKWKEEYAVKEAEYEEMLRERRERRAEKRRAREQEKKREEKKSTKVAEPAEEVLIPSK